VGSALALLLWAYVFGRIMTASAVLNASLWARVRGRHENTAADEIGETSGEIPGRI
jgi:uncharacterized BrkB/YihY/UPF0761 family membrane protein